MHPDSADSKQRQRARSDAAVLPRHRTRSARGGNDKAVLAQHLDAFFREQWEGLIFLRVKGLEAVCVYVCDTSHLLLNPISKAWGLNQPSPLKVCQGKAHK